MADSILKRNAWQTKRHRGPIGLDYKLFEAWSDDQQDKWWRVYLWYRYADIRPGFALVYAATPDATDAVWCRIRREKD